MNTVYSGSFVTYGQEDLVTGIGMETEVGKIASLLKTTSEREHHSINLDQFGEKLSIIIRSFVVFCLVSVIPRRKSVMHLCLL